MPSAGRAWLGEGGGDSAAVGLKRLATLMGEAFFPQTPIMAGQAAKKAKANASSVDATWNPILLAVNVRSLLRRTYERSSY